MRGAQRTHQRLRCARLSHGHSVNPHQRLYRRDSIETEALADMTEVFWLSSCAPREAQQREGEQRNDDDGIDQAMQLHFALAPVFAAHEPGNRWAKAEVPKGPPDMGPIVTGRRCNFDYTMCRSCLSDLTPSRSPPS